MYIGTVHVSGKHSVVQLDYNTAANVWHVM